MGVFAVQWRKSWRHYTLVVIHLKKIAQKRVPVHDTRTAPESEVSDVLTPRQGLTLRRQPLDFLSPLLYLKTISLLAI